MVATTGVGDLLEAARERGNGTIVGMAFPPGLDQFTMAIGLVSRAIELGQLMATEERDLGVIQAHYEIETARIQTAFAEVEAAMIADFKRDESLKIKTFEAITMLIAAGQFEIASEFHKRFMDSLHRSALEVVLEGRNGAAARSNSELRVR